MPTLALPSPEPTRGTPLPTLAPVPAISDNDWSTGPKKALVVLLIYSDFQCEPCAGLAASARQLAQLHPTELRVVFRHYPLVTVHDKSFLAAEAAEAAGDQGSFWPMHDLLFDQQSAWRDLSAEEFLPWLLTAADSLSLDGRRFEQDLQTHRFKDRVMQVFREALASGIPGVPFIFLNGDDLRLPPDLVNLEAAVRLELLRYRQYSEAPPMVIRPDGDYLARLELSKGELTIQLYPDYAPIAVNSFVFLAREGWFDSTIFHRVVPGVVAEGGDPTATGVGVPGYFIPTETDPLRSFGEAGAVGLSGSGPGTNGSQFFVTLSPQPGLDGSRTLFGYVLEGLDLLQALAARDPLSDLLVEPELVIREVVIEER